MQSFHLNQLKYNSGRSKLADMLYTIEMLKEDFLDLKILECKDVEVNLNEGMNHQGQKDVVNFLRQKI